MLGKSIVTLTPFIPATTLGEGSLHPTHRVGSEIEHEKLSSLPTL